MAANLNVGDARVRLTEALSRQGEFTDRSCPLRFWTAPWCPGRVFDRTVGLEQVPDGYRVMNDRIALKILIQP